MRAEIETRTPGFNGWQQEQWLACCGLRGEYELSNEGAEEFAGSLRKDDQPTAYIFRCLHCNKYLAYADEP